MPRRNTGNDFTGPEAPPGYQLGQSGASLPPEATQTDERGRKYVVWPDGSKFFLRPQAGTPLWFEGSNGGMIHNPDAWNPKTGEWEPGGVNWSALGSWLALGAMGGYAGYVAAAGPAAATAASSGVGIGETGAVTGLAGSGLGTAAGVGAGTAAGTGGAAWAGLPEGVAGEGGLVGGTSAANIGGGLVPTSSTAGVVGKLGGWGNLIGIGAQLGGQYMANRAASKATDKQIAANERAAQLEAQSAREALDFLKARALRQDQLEHPYNSAGSSAVTKLSQLMGLGSPPPYVPTPGLEPSYNPNTTQGPNQAPPPAAPGVNVGDPRLGPANLAMAGSNTAPNGTLASLSGIGGSVLMQAPDGSQRQVPQAMVAEATAKGARVISNGLG